MSFEKVAAFLRLGSKYEMQQFRAEALRRLTREFPSDLSGWDTDAWQHVHFQTAIEHDAYNLVTETGCHSLLPAAFFTLVGGRDDALSAILEGESRSDGSVASLSSENQRTCIRAVEILQRMQRNEASKRLDTGDGVFIGCTKPSKCSSQRRQMFQGTYLAGPLIESFGRSLELKNSGLCAVCIAKSESLYDEGNKKIWNELPSMLGLPGWDELLLT